MRANLDSLQKIYNKYLNSTKKHIDMNDCLEIVAELQISEMEIKQAYGFAKSLIIDEMN